MLNLNAFMLQSNRSKYEMVRQNDVVINTAAKTNWEEKQITLNVIFFTFRRNRFPRKLMGTIMADLKS